MFGEFYYRDIVKYVGLSNASIRINIFGFEDHLTACKHYIAFIEELAWCETEHMSNSQLFDVCDSTTKHAVEITSGILASALLKLGFTGNPDDLFNADAESALPYYLVTLKLQIGEIEKTAKHLVQAINEEVAIQAAFEHECHDEPVFDGGVCWDMNQEMAYSCLGVEPVPYHLAMILRKLL